MIVLLIILGLSALCFWSGYHDVFIHFRYVVSVLFGVVGILIFFINFKLLVSYKKGKKYVGGIPIFGGLSLCMAIAVFPNNPYAWLCWVALIIDFQWGIPGILYSIYMNWKIDKK